MSNGDTIREIEQKLVDLRGRRIRLRAEVATISAEVRRLVSLKASLEVARVGGQA